MENFATSTAFDGPKPSTWVSPTKDDNATRRKPRTYASPDMGSINPDPWPLDFCIWLQSVEFGNNRRHILQLTGATWIGEDKVPTNGTLFEGAMSWLRKRTGLPAPSSTLAK